MSKPSELQSSMYLRLPTAAPDGEIARILLAFLTTAGFFYVNIMPALVDGLISGMGLSGKTAGLVGSANVYGAALGSLGAVFLVKRITWKPVSVGLLLCLIALDSASMLMREPIALIVLRFVHGCIGGLLVGIGFSIISRTREADRTFGYLLTIQFGLGGLGLLYLPGLVGVYGTGVLFLSLVAFSSVTLLMLPFLGEYPVAEPDPALPQVKDGGRHRSLLAMALAATFLFQAGNMGIYAYIIGIGKSADLDVDFISSTLGIAAWIAIAGSVLVILLSTRFGRLVPVSVATLLTVLGTFALHYSQFPAVFWVANVGVGIAWAFVISYLLGMCAAFDQTGQSAALAGFISKMGLATGPMVAALMLGEDDYVLVVNIAVLSLILSLALLWVPAHSLDGRLNP